MRYELTFLDDKEFESLPYLDTQTSLGLADTKKGKAYVRRTGVKAVDVFTAMHELEHLEGDKLGEHDRYGNGVYYKDFGSALSGAANSAMGGLGSAANLIGSSIGGAAKSIGGAANSVGSFISNPLQAFQPGKAPVSSMANAVASGSQTPGSSSSIYPGVMGLSGALNATQPNLSGPFSSKLGASGLLSSPQIKLPSSSTSMSLTPSASTQTAQPQAPQGQGGLGGMLGGVGMDLLKQAGGGLLSKFVGSSGPQGGGARLPDMSGLESVQAFKNYDLRGQMNQLDPGLESAINRDFDQMDQQEQHDFQSRWKNIRPGADIESDSVYKRDYQNLLAEQQQRRADAMSKYRFDYVKTQLGINELEAQRLQTLAQLDVQTIAINTGLEQEEAMQLKQMFSGETQAQPQGGGILDTLLRPAVQTAGQRIGGYVGNMF